MTSKTKARYDILSIFNALKIASPPTGGQLTVTTRPAPSRAVRMPDPRSAQEVVTSMCQTIHGLQAQNRALEERLAALEQGKFGMSGQPATLVAPTTARNAMEQSAPAWLTINVTKPRGQTNVRACPMVQARARAPDAGYAPASGDCPLASGHNGGYGAW